MPTEVRVPTTGNAGEAAVVLDWNVSVGSSVAAGDILVSLETAKAVVEVDAPTAGVVLDIKYAEGDEAPEHDVLLVLGEPGERLPEPAPAAAPPVMDSPPVAAEPTSTPSAPAVATDPRRRVGVSPRAKRLAAERGIDTAAIQGSGPFGRVVIADIEAATRAGAEATAPAAAPAAAPTTSPTAPTAPAATEATTVVPVRGARKVTAQRMHESLQGTAQVTLTRYAPGDALVAYAARLKRYAESSGERRIGINDLILFATARTVAKHPAANSWFAWEGITQFATVHLGFAVDTGQALLVPVIAQADTLTLSTLAERAQEAIQSAKEGRLTTAQMSGGTFTVSNLGGLGIHWFTPVLNPPQSCILGIGAAHRSHPDAAAQIPLSLTFDHRALDGAAAAALLADIATAIENIDILAAY